MTNQEIKTVGQTIAAETQIGGNTAARVGGVIEGIGDALDNKDAAVGYYLATMSGSTIYVNSPSYRLGTGGNMRVKMPAAATTACTLTVGNANAVPLWYNGAAVSADNSWEAGEIVTIFYDGTRFMASNSQGGGGQFGSGEKIKDILLSQVLGAGTDAITSQKGVSDAIFNEIDISSIDTLKTLNDALAPSSSLKPTYYTVTAMLSSVKLKVGSMAVISDNMRHVVTEIMATHYLLDDAGNLTNEHSDAEIFFIYRSVKLSGGTLPDPAGVWTRWRYVNASIWSTVAEKISYNNSQSGLAATDVQEALDEIGNVNFVEERYIETGARIGYIIDNSGVWTNKKATHKAVHVKGGEKYKIVANSELPTVYRFLTSDTVNPNNPAQLSVIDGAKHLINAGEYTIVTVPSDANYLYFQGTMASSSGTINYAPADLVKIESLKDIVENNTSDILENRYDKVIGRRVYNFTSNGLILNTHGLGFTAGIKYKIKMSFSSAPYFYTGVMLYATNSSSSDNVSVGNVPADVTEYELVYTPEESKNYQYLGLVNNTQSSISVDVTVLGSAIIADKFKSVDSGIYIEYPFEQGSIGLDGELLVDSDIELRSKDFIKIQKPTTIVTNSGYQIDRVFAYNADGTLNAVLNREQNPVATFELTDAGLIYKITITRTNGEPISPDEEGIAGNSVKDMLYDTIGLDVYKQACRTVYVAAADSIPSAKAIADYICDGVNDEVEIQNAINSLPYGGTVQLLDGRYNIDAFPQTIDYGDGRINHIAIFIAGNANRCRSLLIKGTTENKGYHSRYGVHIHVSSSAIAEMNDTDTYTCIMGSGIRPAQWGDYTFSNNVNFENFFIYIGDAEKKMVGINCTHFGGTHMEHVCIYTESYMEKRFAHQKPPTPVEGSIGIITNCGSNDAIDCGFYYIDCSGMYIGLMTQDAQTTAIDHLVIIGGCFCRCVYGLYFKTGTPKTMTLINCCDEGCTHLPYFGNSIDVRTANHITMIDFNVERFNKNYYPDDPTGNTEFYAVEQTPGQWIGTIEYTLQGSPSGWSGADPGNAGQHFWKNDGSGRGVRTRNLNEDHTGYSQPHCGEYLEQYFDTANNVWKTWNGSDWV